MVGIDQNIVKVSGTTLHIAPNSLNENILTNFASRHGEGEKHDTTHPITSS
jgi:hypothetical protein